MTRNRQPLSQRISACISAVADGKALDRADLRSALTEFRDVAQAFENSQAALELEAHIDSLNSELENLKSDFQAQRDDLKTQLDAANSEILRLREQQKSQQENQAELPEPQLMILFMLPSENEGSWAVKEAYERTSIPISEAQVHLEALNVNGYISYVHSAFGRIQYYRNTKGTKYLMAWRQAFDPLEKRSCKFPDFGQPKERILLMLVDKPNGVSPIALNRESRGAEALRELELDAFVGSVYAHPEAFVIVLLGKGFSYLCERGKL